MKILKPSQAILLVLATGGAARGQAPPTSAKVETAPLALTAPDRFQVPAILLPVRRVTVVAMSDGVVRSIEAPIGSAVREGQEVAQLDRAEAAARLKIALANVKEKEAVLKGAGTGKGTVYEAQLEGAQARAAIAQLELDRCTLRAPFAGRVLSISVSSGQYVAKGTEVAELADVTALRVLVPVVRSSVAPGASLSLGVEGKDVAAKVQAILPLPESHAVLRELATPLAAAWAVVSNADGTLEPGQRVHSPALPAAPIATIPARALRQPESEGQAVSVQVLRNEYVVDIPVRVLGNPVPDRVQVSGAFRPADALIVSATVPLLAGTLVRFGAAAGGGGGGGVEGTTPNPAAAGDVAGLSPSPGAARPAPASNALPRARNNPRPAPRRPAGNPPAGGAGVPF